MAELFREIVEDYERQTENVRRLDSAMGVSFVSMVHPKTGKVVPVEANPAKVLRNLVKGFVMVLNSDTGKTCKLAVGTDQQPDFLIRKFKAYCEQLVELEEAEREADEEGSGVHGEGEDDQHELAREDGTEGTEPDESDNAGERGPEVSDDNPQGSCGRSESTGRAGSKSKRGRKSKK